MEGGKMKKADFVQSYEMRNGVIRDTMRTMYLSQAKSILMKIPFGYSERISQEVAEGIIDHADKLMANADVEEDEDSEMNELNNMGDVFQTMQNSTCLMLSVDNASHADDEAFIKEQLPMPLEPKYNIKNEHAKNLPECLKVLKKFIHHTSSRGFSATIAFLGMFTEDGLEFGGGGTIPRQVLETQVSKLMFESDELCPQTIDLVFLMENREVVAITTIRKEKNLEDFVPKHVLVELQK